MDFMPGYFQDHRNYALHQIVLVQKKIDLLCWLDQSVSDNYADYISALYAMEEDMLEEIAERQEEQDLPTKEKIDQLVVEMMFDVFVDCENLTLYDALEKHRPVFN